MTRLTHEGILCVSLLLAIPWYGCSGEILSPDQAGGPAGGPAPGGTPSQTPQPPVVPGDPSVAPPDAPGESTNGPHTTGLSYWNAQCASCHGDFSSDSVLSTGDLNGDFRLDAQSALAEHGNALATYIGQTMPLADVTACQGECAELTAAYIESYSQPITIEACDDMSPRGERRFVLLNSREYQRSLENLLGISSDFGALVANNDGARGGFRNMQDKLVNGTVLDQYFRNAEALADWAIAQGRPFACATGCADRFVNEFLPLAFRGQVTAEQRELFRGLFDDFGADGLRVALEAALSSPYFLYRVEVGADLQTAREAGWYSASSASEGSEVGSSVNGETVETIEGPSFFTPDGGVDGDAWVFLENGSVDLMFGAAFTDPALVEVVTRGSNHRDHWPELTVRVDGRLIGRVTVDHTDMRPYRFEVLGVTGRPVVNLAFENDSGEAPYDEGNDANLYIQQASLLRPDSQSTPAPAPTPEPDPSEAPSILDLARAGDYVLSPVELASSLSFMLTGAGPDAELLAAAQSGQLSTKEDLRTQIERLLDSPAGREHVGEFIVDWYGFDKVLSVNRPNSPALTPEVRAAMREEIRQHFLHIVYEDAPYSEFFAGDYTFLNDTLASFYGVPGSFGSSFQRAEVPGRGGPIASGAFMTIHAHAERSAPILRAVHARQDALCHYIDPPNSPLAGDDIDMQRAVAQALVAEREQQEGALSSRDFYYTYTDGIDACASCHEKIINPMFGLEDFDNIGRMRPSAGADAVLETIGGTEKVVSLQGTLYGVESTADPAIIDYAGAKDFSRKIADAEALDRCLVRKTFRWATGLPLTDRDVDGSQREDLSSEQRQAFACLQSDLLDTFEAANEDPRTLIIELALESLLPLRR